MQVKGDVRVPLGVVMEWRKIEHRWARHVWRPVSVIAGAAELDPAGDWTPLLSEEGRATYHAGTLPLDLYAREADGYRLNLSQKPPRIFVVLRRGEGATAHHELLPHHVTACPFEAQEYLDGDELVEPVTMPPTVLAMVAEFLERLPEPEAFKKRPRKQWHGDRRPGLRFSAPATEEGGDG